jgi:hypothetical protein
MIKCTMTGETITANQLAKDLLVDRMEVALEFWQESILVNQELMTDKELQDVDRQLMKRYVGIIKYLNYKYKYTGENDWDKNVF